MASSENVTKEKSSDFDDGVYDPDLEARLYAEIYYSNETYVPNDDSLITNDTQISTNCVTNECVNSALNKETNTTIEKDNIVIDEHLRKEESCSKNIWISEEFNRNVRREGVKQRRLLAHEGLWSTSNTEPKKSIPASNIPVAHSKSPGDTQSINRIDVISNSVSSPKKTIVQRKGKNSKRCGEEISNVKNRSPKKNRNRNNADITERGKYKIISKKKKLKMLQMNSEPVNISSDSDDSILEVPVPPKAPPVIIQLPDSEDDSEKCADTIGEKTDKTFRSPEIDSRSRNSVEIFDETRRNARNSSEEFVEPACPDNNGLILNCTEIQRGASSLDEIRKMRETIVPSIHTHSDDSMTESEANNWHSIADGQSDVARDEEIASVDTENSLIWNQLRQEHVATIVALPGPSSEIINSIDSTEQLSTPTRKRPKDFSTSTTPTDLHIPVIPEKRSKQSKEESFTEYFFKPMSKKLQAFYNNPWGGENMNLYDIQSRMPKNPRCWTILDADLQGPTSKRRRACPRCKTDSHFGKRCPEKPKAPCCYMCGTKGHTESRCPHTMCLTCGRKYATYRPTCGYCSRLHCDMCKGSGHDSENCPDLWRRYHNTTSETLPIAPREPFDIMKAPQFLTCCNCAKRGHDVTMCKQLRWSQHFTTPIYVSSYTRGPFYESFNDPNDFSRDYSISDGIHLHSNTASDPVHMLPHRETTQEFNNATTSNETFKIIEDVHIPIAVQPSIILKLGDLEWIEAKNCHKISRHLDNTPKVHLDGLLSGRLVPIFLHEWQKYFEFRIGITRDSFNRVLMVLEAKTSAYVQALDKVIMQWLMRNDDEKVNLEYGNILPYDNPEQLSKVLKIKINLLRTVMEPAILHKKILALEETIKYINAKIVKEVNSKKKEKRRSNYDSTMRLLTKRRGELVTSLYGRTLVKGSYGTVRSFRQLVRKNRSEPNKQWSLYDYLELIYLNNEIFTSYMNANLSAALNRVLSKSKQSEDPSQQVVSLETESINDCKIPGNSISAYSSPLGTENPQEITIVEDRIGGDDESSRIPSVFGLAETSNTNDEIPVELNEQWKAPFKPVGVITRLNGRKLPNEEPPVVHINDETNQVLLRRLTKRNRKLYRNTARNVIKLANMSNIPHLKKMAKVMKFKMGNGSATTEDVHKLQSAIEKSSKRKYQFPKQHSKSLRPSLLNNYEKTHKDFQTIL